MKDKQIKEIHALMENFFCENEIPLHHILAFITTTFVGTLEMHGYSQDFFDKTCERMKNEFREKRKIRGSK
mgnify:CR=1 FL=1